MDEEEAVAASLADVRADLLVAGAAAAGTIALAAADALTTATVDTLGRLLPLVVYPLYVLLGKGDTGARIERPRYWMLFATLVTLGVGAYAGFA